MSSHRPGIADRSGKSSNFLIEGLVFDPLAVRELQEEAESGDVRARKLILALELWMMRAERSPPERAPHCIDCDAVFTVFTVPRAFAIALIPDEGTAVVTGVCKDCVEHAQREPGGVMSVAVRWWRENLWPDAQVLPPATERRQ